MPSCACKQNCAIIHQELTNCVACALLGHSSIAAFQKVEAGPDLLLCGVPDDRPHFEVAHVGQQHALLSLERADDEDTEIVPQGLHVQSQHTGR